MYSISRKLSGVNCPHQMPSRKKSSRDHPMNTSETLAASESNGRDLHLLSIGMLHQNPWMSVYSENDTTSLLFLRVLFLDVDLSDNCVNGLVMLPLDLVRIGPVWKPWYESGQGIGCKSKVTSCHRRSSQRRPIYNRVKSCLISRFRLFKI